MMPGIDLAPFVNWIIGIPDKLDSPEIRPQMEQLISLAINARKEVGICSLSESCDIEEMWQNYYAGDGTGYCVEYDVEDYEFNKSILPVVYDDKREKDAIMQLTANFISQTISGFSGGRIVTDQSQFIRLFLNKNAQWAYQREWRLIDYAGKKPKAPKISRIILGKNVSDENRAKMEEFCRSRGILLI